MRILTATTALTVVLFACQPGGQLGGGDPGWELDDAPFEDMEGQADTASGFGDVLRDAPLPIDNVECVESDEELPQVLSTVVSGTSVSVTHEGVGTWCEAEWQATVSISSSNTIAVDYGDNSGITAETAECWCQFTVTYTVTDLTPGEWTVSALTESTTFTIE